VAFIGLSKLLASTHRKSSILTRISVLQWLVRTILPVFPKLILNPLAVAFDVHISEISQAWCLGIRLVSAPRPELLGDLQNNIIRLGITNLAMVPSMIEATLTTPEDLPLKYMASGGEKISDAVSVRDR
jgi:hypothetical protein